ncbi:DNA replication complex GINS protein PSF2 {ECO:0000256/PIRNR:PIRNR028998} [Serendipita indica DSM 11827]|nr:DNA replication complex GINS protein PSF2 {ECO:0000256/PIRNR:PIRNR028998} [Serendipita indica DSM 11827]
MALPANLKQAPTPQELEYITGEIIVAIEPLFRMEKVRLVSVRCVWTLQTAGEDESPAVAGTITQAQTEMSNRPPGLGDNFLTLRLQQETSQSELSKMPFRYAEVAKVLLDIASDDIMEPDKIRILLKDIREARQAKSRQLLLALDAPYTTTENLCSMEICEMRLFFSSAMGIISKLDVEAPAQDEEMYDF